MFGSRKVAPHLSLQRSEIIKDVRKKSLRMSVGGAQPKASLAIRNGELEVVGSGGTYLLKPSTEMHPHISENEHFCMTVARESGLEVAECCLITLEGGEFAFLTKRFDRAKKSKIHLEDFASVLERPAHEKYSRTYCDIVSAAKKHCRDIGLERIRIFRLILLSYVIGNNDLHLKNFSLLDQKSFYRLSPAYDIVCSTRYYPDQQDLALEFEEDYLGSLRSLGYYTSADFLYFSEKIGLRTEQAERFIADIIAFKSKMLEVLTNSFLPPEEQAEIEGIIERQVKKLAT